MRRIVLATLSCVVLLASATMVVDTQVSLEGATHKRAVTASSFRAESVGYWSTQERRVLGSRTSADVTEYMRSNRYHDKQPGTWEVHSEQAHKLQPVSFAVMLKQRNLEALESRLLEVSDPEHEHYGKYMTIEEIDRMVAPEEKAFQVVGDWLLAHGVGSGQVHRLGDHFQVTANVEIVEKLFATRMALFRHDRTQAVVARVADSFSVPHEVHEHIHMVAGLSELFLDNGRQAVATSYDMGAVDGGAGEQAYGIGEQPNPRTSPFQSLYHQVAQKTGAFAHLAGGHLERVLFGAVDDSDEATPTHTPTPTPIPEFSDTGVQQIVTPTILRDYYGLPRTEKNESPENLQGLGAFMDIFRSKALCMFQSTFENRSRAAEKVTMEGPAVAAGEYESDLDVQYMTAIGKGVPTKFTNHLAGYWVLQYALQTFLDEKSPFVHSLSYGYPELWTCVSGRAECAALGYDARAYVDRFNVEMKKLGLRGRTFFVASGDDGAPGFGNCQMDATRLPCPLGNGQCLCHGVRVDDVSKNAHCVLPTGFFNESCGLVKNTTSDCYHALKEFSDRLQNHTLNNDANGAACAGNVQWHEAYSNCTCSVLKPVTVGSCTVRGHDYDASFGPPTLAVFPGSSPWVTSVGATSFMGDTPCGSGSLKFGEQAASIATGSGFTTGGGFSQFQDAPDYQKGAVSAYFQTTGMAKAAWFDATKRGYPDISLNGRNFLVVSSKGKERTKCCSVLMVDGTSASTPSLAGMFSLINGKLLAQKKPTVGFLNPALYKMDSKVFNDVTSGDNKCTKFYCCKEGFSAAKGWDPVTGLGTPKYQELLKHFGLTNTPSHPDVPDLVFWIVIGCLSVFCAGVSGALFVTCQRLESAKKGGSYSMVGVGNDSGF